MVVTILMLSACGRGRNIANDTEAATHPGGNRAVVQHTGDVETFLISAPFGNPLTRMQESAEAFRQTLEEQGRIVEFNFIYSMQGEEEAHAHAALLLSKFAAGAGPDIFVRGHSRLYPFIENGFIADIYAIIDQSANFSRGDFFTNALDGIAIDGRLNMLPTQFGIDYIGINANVPPAFMARFNALGLVSPRDIMEIYLDLISEHPQWTEFALINGFNASQAFMQEIDNGINVTAGTVNFSPLTDYLGLIRAGFMGNDRFEPTWLHWQNAVESFEIMEERYVFSRLNGPSTIFAVFNFDELPFINYMPLVDENGRLVNRPAWHSIDMAVSRTANPELAMGLMAQVISDDATEARSLGLDAPILRRYFDDALYNSLHSTFTSMMIQPPLIDSVSYNVSRAVNRIREYVALPSNTLFADYLFFSLPVFAPFNDFMESDTPPSQAISQMETNLTTWLNEQRPEIEPFSEEDDVHEQPEDLTVQTLTIRTNSHHQSVMVQAAEAMSAAWMEQGIPYLLELNLEVHSFNDWTGAEGRANRLQTELMAGLGPDIFTFDPMTHHIHTLAASGFLRDIYELMDADPNTSRDEFFTEALKAFEINNGLYMFPVSFGFEYLGINAKLPQPFIDRFAQKDTISFTEMMEFYLDFKYAYGDEFGHLSIRSGNHIYPNNILQATMGGFVDFNTRTSNLTDPRFIESLELIRTFFYGWEHTPEWRGNIFSPSFLQDRAQESVFYFHTRGLQNFDAFFTADPPIFIHHIPLANDSGRLLIDHPGVRQQVWAGICITTAGNGLLAWKFTRHLIYAYTNPVGRAAVEPYYGMPTTWGTQSFATPILRSLFRESTMRNFIRKYEYWSGGPVQTFVGFDNEADRLRQFEAAVNRIAAYNEQPMAMLSASIPWVLWRDPFEQFQLGLIPAETAAQRIHNAVSLWLIE